MLITACESRWTKTTVALTLERLHCLKINLSGDERKKKRESEWDQIYSDHDKNILCTEQTKKKDKKKHFNQMLCNQRSNLLTDGELSTKWHFFDARQLELKISTLPGASFGGEKEPTHVVVTLYVTIDLLCWSSLEELLLTHLRKSNDVQVLIVEAEDKIF